MQHCHNHTEGTGVPWLHGCRSDITPLHVNTLLAKILGSLIEKITEQNPREPTMECALAKSWLAR